MLFQQIINAFNIKFEEALMKFKAKQITIEEAMSMSGISSRSTFYRRKNEI